MLESLRKIPRRWLLGFATAAPIAALSSLPFLRRRTPSAQSAPAIASLVIDQNGDLVVDDIGASTYAIIPTRHTSSR